VSGGTLISESTDYEALYSGGANGQILVSGGEVSSDKFDAIMFYGTGSKIAVEGGLIKGGRYGIRSGQAGAQLVVSGGAVQGTSIGIYAHGANAAISVSGGKISGGGAIYAQGESANIAVTGGEVEGGTSFATITAYTPTSTLTVRGDANVHNSAAQYTLYSKGSTSIAENASIQNEAATTTILCGSLFMMSGGKVHSNQVRAIYNNTPDAVISISGGEVTNNSTAYSALQADGAGSKVSVSGGLIKGYRGILLTGENAEIAVSGGDIEGGSTGNALYTTKASSKISILGEAKLHCESSQPTLMLSGEVLIWGDAKIWNTETEGGSYALYAPDDFQKITITGGELSSSRGVIQATKATAQITVSGTAKVLSSSAEPNLGAIAYNGPLYVGGDAEIVASGAAAALHMVSGTASLVASGGSIESTGGNFAVTASEYGTSISLRGTAKVTSASDTRATIQTRNVVEVSEDASVQNKGSYCAIQALGYDSPSLVTVGGGTVRSGGARAIHVRGDDSTLSVGGGVVFSCGDAVSGSATSAVHLQDNPTGFAGPEGTGMVIAWDKAAGNTVYPLRSTQDLAFSPAGASAAWSSDAALGAGIFAKNQSEEHFLDVEGITISRIALTADDFDFELPEDAVFDGNQHGIVSVACVAPGFDAGTGGTLTIRYTGWQGTAYDSSTDAPTQAGIYRAEVSVSGGTDYDEGVVVLGVFPIARAAASTLPLPTASTVSYGSSLSSSTLTGDAALGLFGWAQPSIIPIVKNNGYTAILTPSAFTLRNYDVPSPLTWTAIVTVVPVEVAGFAQTVEVAAGSAKVYNLDLKKLLPAGMRDDKGLAFSVDALGIGNGDGVLNPQSWIGGWAGGKVLSPLPLDVLATAAGKTAYIMIRATSDNYVLEETRVSVVVKQVSSGGGGGTGGGSGSGTGNGTGSGSDPGTGNGSGDSPDTGGLDTGGGSNTPAQINIAFTVGGGVSLSVASKSYKPGDKLGSLPVPARK
jgi:hypothetical protein